MNKKFLSVVLFGALLASSAGTFTSCKDYDDDINGLQEQIDANKKTLDEKSAALQTAFEKANADITAAKAAAAAAQTAADQAKATGDQALVDAAAAAQAAAAANVAASQAEANAIAKAQALVNELKLVVDKKVDQTVYAEKMGLIDGELNVIDGKLEGLVEADIAINEQIDALNIFKADITALNLTVAFPELQGKVAGLVQELSKLSARVTANEVAIADLKETLGTLSEQVNAIEGNLNTLTALLSSRLTSLTFAPTEFISGIEVINFATLEYKPWTVLLADATDGTTSVSINDGKTTAVYYANPSSVKKANIKGLSVLLQDATNTRAASEIKIEANLAEDEIQNGKMMVNLKKLSEGSLNQAGSATVEKFTLLALRADIELTQEEIAKGIAPTVVSDWARLAETAVVPFIHNKAYATTDPVEDLDAAVIPHFYPYSKIHNAVAADAVCNTKGQYIVKSESYMAPVNLKDMVAICDKAGHRYEAANYKLEFEFKLVDYYLQEGAEQKTNQKLFAKITDGVLTSQSREGIAENRDAIGREPLVQVVLKDLTNGKVVDVRYLKIQWISEVDNEPLGNLGEFVGNFNKDKCNTAYVNTVGEEKMNGVYTHLNISNTEFHQLYTLDANVYASEAEAAKGTPAATKLGSIAEIAAPGSTMTQNLEWTLPIADNVITADEYTAGKAVRKVYGRYVHTIDAARTCTFELTLELKVKQMELIALYNESYWNIQNPTAANADKMRLINPALTSDDSYGITNFFDCQIIGTLLKGYSMTTAITAPLDLVSNAQNASFVFDADRLTQMNLPGTGWAISTDGLTLNKGGVSAASITSTGGIRLSEINPPTVAAHGTPTEPAKLLLGKIVPVKLISSYCNGADGTLNVVLDHFLAKFVDPLDMTLSDAPASFQDLITGGSKVTITGIATIKETFGLKRTVWANGIEATSGLAQWYNVKNVTWDLENAKTNLKKNADGSISIVGDVMAGDWNDVKDQYKLSATPSNVNATTLIFENNSGDALLHEIKIAVPVFADTKWNNILDKGYVILTVKPGVVPARR